MRNLARALLVALALMLSGGVYVGPAGAFMDTDDDTASLAWFEGRQIDLRRGWGAANACAITDDGTICFRSEAQMDRALGLAAGETSPSTSTPNGAASIAMQTCSSSLRLYDGTSYTGQVLFISTRWVYLNLGLYGFDNRASSYSVGACSADLFSGSSGGGSVLFASAWTANSNMGGWSNITSSVYLY